MTKYMVIKLLSNYEGKLYPDGKYKLFLNAGDELPVGYSEEEISILKTKRFITEYNDEAVAGIVKQQVEAKGNKIKILDAAKELNMDTKQMISVCRNLFDRKIKTFSWITAEEMVAVKEKMKNDSN